MEKSKDWKGALALVITLLLSLITANFALDYNRDVFAVPGFPEDPRCRGSNELIKKGAILVSSADDIINNFTFNCSEIETQDDIDIFGMDFECEISDESIDSCRKEVLQLLSYEPVSIDDLINEIGSVQAVQIVLIELELAGKISRIPVNKVVLNLNE